MKKVRDFLIISFLGLMLFNLTLISAVIIFIKYGAATLYPGESYTLNIPFLGQPSGPVICGKAQKITGEALQGINVSAYYQNNLITKNTTNSKGEYCLTFPEITTNRKYDIFVEYENQTPENLMLGSNDYTLNFLNNQVYSKSTNNYVTLQGTIENEDAEIENGRFEINLKYYKNSSWEEVFDYQKYAVNIAPEEIYEIPNQELNISWKIPSNAPTGRYKFYIKTSFNAKEHTSNIYFNLTE